MLALAVGLSGCSLRGAETEDAAVVALPEPEPQAPDMILGEEISSEPVDITLYIPTADGRGFSRVSRRVAAQAGPGAAEAAVNALLSEGRNAGFTADTRMLGFECGRGLATVTLSIDARGTQSAQDLLTLIASIGNTLLTFDGIDGVNVLIGGQSEGFLQLPLGVQTEAITSVTAAYAQLQSDREHLTARDGFPAARMAALYFPSESGGWLVPELREITLESDDFIQPLIDALIVGPLQERCLISPIPEGVELLDGAPQVETTLSGEHILTLNFSPALANYLAFSGLEVWGLAGSLSLTLSGFVPGLDAIRIMVNGDPISMCAVNDRIMRFADGLIRREDFAGRVGSVETLFLPGRDGCLQTVRRAVSMRGACSPRSLLIELFTAAKESDAPWLSFADAIYPEDLLGVRVADEVANVNLSADFYRACQTLDAAAERGLVYAIVNTLCQLDGIRGVRFRGEGLATDTLSGGIYLKSTLLPNPGIIESTYDDTAQ